MDKMKKFLKGKFGLAALIAILIFISAIIYARRAPQMILFYSESCPHCKNVEAYISENGIKNKIKFEEKEVSQNQANATLLERKARSCKMDIEQGIGIPFFFDGKECFMGDEPIIEHFKSLE